MEEIEGSKQVGTVELGMRDRTNDGSSTRRRRRQVIVLKQRRGSSLGQTLIQSPELKSLGLSFTKFQSDSVGDLTSPKHKKIVLRMKSFREKQSV